MSRPLKTPRQARSRATWNAILEAATQLFSAFGYNGTSTNQVAERAGVSIGSLYQYFPNKNALLFALAERHLTEVMGAISDEVIKLEQEQPDLEETVTRMVEIMLKLHRHDPATHSLVFSYTLGTPELRDQQRTLDQFAIAIVMKQLKRLGLAGKHPETRALLLVQGLEAQVHGAVLEPPDNQEPAALIEELSHLWLSVARGWRDETALA